MKSTFSPSRRRFLFAGGLGLTAVSLAYVGLGSSKRGESSELFLTAHKHKNQHFVSAMNLGGNEYFRTSTPSACHSITTHSASNTMVGISRDPEAPALAFNAQNGESISHFFPREGRHFNGHGCISDDGRYFFATQNAFEEQRGVIAVYDIESAQQIEEYDSGGQGPHEIHLLSDKRTLVIANGGIQTHPESGRKSLNLAKMHPKLSYLDSSSGEQLDHFDLPDRRLSIRHVAVGSDDTVGLALQYKGKREFPPVVGFQKGQREIQLVKSDDDQTHWKMNQYTASICIHPETGVTAITCPRGNLITFWDSRDRKFISSIEIFDASGVALSRDGRYFFVTSGTGSLYHIDAHALALSSVSIPEWPNAHWGNHFSQITV
ncbi:MAG: DUF1513 domain-containing protein [Oleiphilaceae bacterium]|nr:DUF1513 domain-containing protein [Oleiphilaceae bacterium]